MADSHAPKSAATDKERFDQCIAMLKAYYDGIETRLAQNVTAYLVAIGWVLTSETARKSLADTTVLVIVLIVVAFVFVMYALNIIHYVKRWREIRNTVDALSYLDPKYYARYELPGYTRYTYIAPVAVLCALLVFLLFWVHRGSS